MPDTPCSEKQYADLLLRFRSGRLPIDQAINDLVALHRRPEASGDGELRPPRCVTEGLWRAEVATEACHPAKSQRRGAYQLIAT